MFASARPFLPVLLLLSVSSLNAQSPAVPCEPTAEVKHALREAPASMQQRAAALRALRERFPNDLFVHRAYQEAVRYDAARAADMVKEYAALAGEHPGDPLFRHLAANALIGTRTPDALAELEQQAEQFPWAHMSLVQVYRAPNFRDIGKLRGHLEAFLDACPAALEAYSWARNVEDAAFSKELAAKLRPLLRERTDADAARAYTALWMLEFRGSPTAEHDGLRKQVAEDVKRLRAAAPEKSRDYLQALRDGYTLAGDPEQAKWAEEQLRSAIVPPAGSNAMAAARQWREKRALAKPGDQPESHAAYSQAYLEATAEWVRQWPNDISAWVYRIGALRGATKVAPVDVLTAGDAVLRLYPDGGFRTTPPLHLQVAELYLAKKVGRDRVPELVRRAMEEADKPWGRMSGGDLYPESTPPAGAPGADYSRAHMQFSGWSSIARVWLELGDKQQARESIQRLDSLLTKLRPPDKADPKAASEVSKQRTYESSQSTYWERMGKLAELEARKVDALTFYQNAIIARGVPVTRGELVDRMRALWNDLGGTNEGWQAWMTRRSELVSPATGSTATATTLPVGRWTKLDKPLPEFQVTDLRGKKWSLEDFRGKTTFVNFWATW